MALADLEHVIRTKLAAEYGALDIGALLRRWRTDYPEDYRSGKLHSRPYWLSFATIPGGSYSILLENGSSLLLESGDLVLLEG
jgi:hypothetical protein